jgi:hypothetical protein
MKATMPPPVETLDQGPIVRNNRVEDVPPFGLVASASFSNEERGIRPGWPGGGGTEAGKVFVQ